MVVKIIVNKTKEQWDIKSYSAKFQMCRIKCLRHWPIVYAISIYLNTYANICFSYYLLQPAEKQLAATTTDLATNNPMRLLPIVAVLIAIVLLLVILAVIFVIIIRGRNGCANTASSSTSSHPASLAVPATASSMSYQKTHSSHSLRQPLTGKYVMSRNTQKKPKVNGDNL